MPDRDTPFQVPEDLEFPAPGDRIDENTHVPPPTDYEPPDEPTDDPPPPDDSGSDDNNDS
jgi:hypothetical protein